MKMERNKIYYVMVNGELMKFTFDESKTREEFENFLKEKGFESFEELAKCNSFLTEEELIQEILNYQKRIKEEMNE